MDNDKVLLVDDDENVLNGLKRQLRKQFNITTATSGQQALEIARNDGPFAVVVSDMRMPGMSGLQVLEQMQQISPDSMRIMLTGNADQQTAVDAVNEGNVFRFFTKPCAIEVLSNGIQEAIKQFQLVTRTKSDLMANMNHELRTPLNAIIGFSKMMKDQMFGPVDNPTYLEYITDINYSGEYLLGLINDILDVSDFGAGTFKLHEENANLPDIIEASVRLIRPRAEKAGVTVTSSVNSDFLKVTVDVRRVKQILLNLFSNAVKFTPEGGEVSVDAWLNEDGSAVVAVTDTGIGMNEEEIRIALTRFGQVNSGLNRKHQEGIGLGLPFSEGLMELHGGTLTVQSEKGHGTRVTLTFPKARVDQNV